MLKTLSNADRIASLRRLHAQWTAELQQIIAAHPDRAFHLAEATDDLQRLITALESTPIDVPAAPPAVRH